MHLVYVSLHSSIQNLGIGMAWLAIYPSSIAIVSILSGIVVVILIDRLLFTSYDVAGIPCLFSYLI